MAAVAELEARAEAAAEALGLERERRQHRRLGAAPPLLRAPLLELREGALERAVEGHRVGPAPARVEGGGLAEHGPQRRRHALEEALVARRRPLERPRRHPPREQLAGDDAEGEHVGGEPRPPVRLLGRHVAEGPRVGDGGGRRRREARHAEVRERRVLVREDQHVLGLHVAVQDPLRVRMRETRGDVAQDAQCDRARALRSRVVREAPLGEIRGEDEVPVDPVRVAHRHDVGVREPRGDARFVRDRVASPLERLRRVDDLQRDRPILHRVARAPDGRERALPERPLEPVLAQPRSAPEPRGRHRGRTLTSLRSSPLALRSTAGRRERRPGSARRPRSRARRFGSGSPLPSTSRRSCRRRCGRCWRPSRSRRSPCRPSRPSRRSRS
jgi:hypothetical protein